MFGSGFVMENKAPFQTGKLRFPTKTRHTLYQREARERYGLMEFIFLPCSRFPSYSLIFLISQTACLYSLILELRNLSQVREEYKNFGDCSAACGWILPKFWEIVGLMDGQKHTKFHWHRTMYVKMAAKILLDFPPLWMVT